MAVTRVAGVTALGQFVIVTTAVFVSLGVARLTVSDPWLASRTAPRTVGPELRWLVLISAAGASGVVAAAVVLGAGAQPRWFIACPIAFLMIVQDFGRYTAFRRERPVLALQSDLAVLLVGVMVSGVWLALHPLTVTAILASWAVGVAAGTLVSSSRFVGALTPRHAYRYWTNYCRPLALKLGLDTVAYLIGAKGSLYLLAYLASPRSVGIVRIVQTLFSPLALIVAGLTMWLVPLLANQHDPAQTNRTRRLVTTWLALGSIPLVGLAVFAGPWLAGFLFGIDTPPGWLALSLAGVSTCAVAVGAPWVASARVSGGYLPIAWVRLVVAVLTGGGMLAFIMLQSASGYLGLLAIQSVTVSITAMMIAHRQMSAARP